MHRKLGVALFTLAGVLVVNVTPAAAGDGPTPEELRPDEWPRDNGGTGACDNYRCECGGACACGAGCGCGSSTASITPRGASGFTSSNVILRARVSLQDFGPEFTEGNDSWGYTAPSGREYALMGLNSAVACVEISDPTAPVILGNVPHPDSPWSDTKVLGHYAYIVNESGGGVQVVDLSGVDSGSFTLVGSTDLAGQATTNHNIVINTDSGYAYLCGSNGFNGGLVALDLTDPENPVLAGSYTDVYVHDAEVVTFTSGPNAGREIAFCYAGSAGLDIVDVTDKSNMFRISRTTYPGLQYTHQGWYDRANNLVYMNDELDERRGDVATTTSRVIDVSDLSAPVLAGSFSTGLPVIDHNLYIRDGFIFEANYRSGLRIFDATSTPLAPVEVGFFDTFSGPDDTEFDGAWNVYPLFASGNIILSDIQGGLFIFDPAFALGGGIPASIQILSGPGEQLLPTGQMIRARVTPLNGATLSGPPELVIVDAGSSQSVTMTSAGNDEYTGVFPPAACGSIVSYYISATTTNGLTLNEPLSAPVETFTSLTAGTEVDLFVDDFELDTGWVAGDPADTATTGVWERADPVGTEAQPEDDAGAGTVCYITGNALPGEGSGTNDVDDGFTTLTSPVLDATGDGIAFVSYFFWYSNDRGASPGQDVFRVEISNDNGASWSLLEETGENPNQWTARRFRVDEFVTPTDQIRLRFIAADEGAGSIVEAGVDDVSVWLAQCAGACIGDLDADGTVGGADLAVLLAGWGGVSADLTGDSNTDGADLAVLLASWGPCL